jgi:hypothetical protein
MVRARMDIVRRVSRQILALGNKNTCCESMRNQSIG